MWTEDERSQLEGACSSEGKLDYRNLYVLIRSVCTFNIVLLIISLNQGMT